MRGSKRDLPVAMDTPEVCIRLVDWGGMTASLEQHKQTIDLKPLFKGLPDDRCQAPHWGYVVKGSIKYVFSDREEIFQSGDIYYAPPGHYPILQEDSEVVEFSPKDLLQKTIEVAERNMAGMQAG